MIYPNIAAAGFTNWMLNISAQKLSPSQRALTLTIYNAASSNSAVTDQDWYNFNLFAAWRNTYYLVYRDYTYSGSGDLTLNLVAALDFEGNANDSLAVNNGNPSSIVFNAAYGKIMQGALFNGINSIISFSPITFPGDWSLNVWVNPSIGLTTYSSICTNISNGDGLFIKNDVQRFEWHTNSTDYLSLPVQYNVWQMVTMVVRSGILTFYVNGVADPLTFPTFQPFVFDIMGMLAGTFYYNGSVDIFALWSRALSSQEVISLYRSGQGVQYPFY